MVRPSHATARKNWHGRGCAAGRSALRLEAKFFTHSDIGLHRVAEYHAKRMNSPTNPQAKRHIGQILIDQGILTEDQLRIALLEQMKSHLPVGRLLVQLGFVSEATLRDALSEKLGLQSIDLAHIIIDPSALKMVPRDMARRYHVFPVALDRQSKKFIVALADTNNIVAIDQLRNHLKGEYEIELRLAGDSEVDRAIEKYYGHEFSIDGILREIETGEVDYATITEGDEYSQPVVRLISALLADAVERAASDIHFEPEQNFLRIRYRIDGVLRQIRSLHKTYWPAMAVRLKVMSKMNIAETRAPQDGRISATMSGRVVDFRVSSLPTTHGENVVLRILDRQKGIVPLDKLGLDEIQLDLLKRMIARPEGIILVTGPTGSGKTTTLYAALSELNTVDKKIITVEDPVEYCSSLGGTRKRSRFSRARCAVRRGWARCGWGWEARLKLWTGNPLLRMRFGAPWRPTRSAPKRGTTPNSARANSNSVTPD